MWIPWLLYLNMWIPWLLYLNMWIPWLLYVLFSPVLRIFMIFFPFTLSIKSKLATNFLGLKWKNKGEQHFINFMRPFPSTFLDKKMTYYFFKSKYNYIAPYAVFHVTMSTEFYRLSLLEKFTKQTGKLFSINNISLVEHSIF